MEARSVFSSVLLYFRNLFRSTRSISRASWSALLYGVGAGEARKEVTEQYPDPISSRTPDDLPPRSRGLLHNDILKCTGCRECEFSCPVDCIRIETEPGQENSKIWVSVFDIDFAKCVFCGLCVEVCEPRSLTHTHHYESAAVNASELVRSFGSGRVTSEQKSKWAEIQRQREEDERPV
jgi:formate hydrogenlyase subunit 6/NADH:ubiquinone oxidoreductase subunit I